jgi:hypothetical protein
VSRLAPRAAVSNNYEVSRSLAAFAVFAALAASVAGAPCARADDAAAVAPFRAKLVSNLAVARKAATGLPPIAKQAAPKGLTAEERKAWADQSKALAAGATRLGALKARMDAVLAKANAPASELAQINLELATTQQDIEQQSARFAVGPASKTRHDAAMRAIH